MSVVLQVCSADMFRVGRVEGKNTTGFEVRSLEGCPMTTFDQTRMRAKIDLD